MEKVARRRISGADRLRLQAGAAAVKAGGKDAAAVEDEQVARANHIGEISELSIFIPAGSAREVQHAGAAAVGKRLLRDQLFREVKVEVRYQHSPELYEQAALRYSPPGLAPSPRQMQQTIYKV